MSRRARADLPRELTNRLVEHPGGQGEAHGLGETAVPPVSAAIGNAVRDAIGVRIHDLPITPERVLRGLLAQQSAVSDQPAAGEAPR